MNSVESALFSAIVGGTAITSLLSGGSACYNMLAPRGASYPLVVFAHMGGGDANETPRRRKELLYKVEAITTSSLKDAGAIDTQLDTRLHGGTVSVSGWTNYAITRESDFRQVESTPEGDNYYRSGGVYRIRLSE